MLKFKTGDMVYVIPKHNFVVWEHAICLSDSSYIRLKARYEYLGICLCSSPNKDRLYIIIHNKCYTFWGLGLDFDLKSIITMGEA